MESALFTLLILLYWTIYLFVHYLLLPLVAVAFTGGVVALILYAARVDLVNFKKAYRR